jgi:hypothetical protein
MEDNMVLRRMIVFVVVVAAGSVARPRESMAYAFVDISTLINPTHTVQTTATGVNARGVVVGELDGVPTARGFVIANGVGQFLPSPVASSALLHWDCHPTAINDLGTIAGWCELLEQQADPNNFTQLDQRAAIWIGPPYVIVLLPRLPGGSQQEALGINNLGQVFGLYQVPGDQFTTTVGRAFEWDVLSGMRAVPVLTGHGFDGLIDCEPTGIDGLGTIVGNCDDPDTGALLGFINNGATTRALPDVQANIDSPIVIVDISESGLIVGTSNGPTGPHTWIVDGNHRTLVPELDGFGPTRIVNSGAILAQDPVRGIVVDVAGVVQQVAGSGTVALDMNEGRSVVGFVFSDVLAFAAEWVP